MKKLSKTEKIKRLREIIKHLPDELFMCNSYQKAGYNVDSLFDEIPELLNFQPKPEGYEEVNHWVYGDGFISCSDKKFVSLRIKSINEAIKLIQSK